MNEVNPRRLGDKYVLLDLLGIGGMAEVYRGILIGERGFEKLIVIKQLLEQFTTEPEHVAQFTSEARLAALLQHENIATTYDFGEVDGRYFMAMEYLFGKDLFTVIQTAKRTGALTPQLALMICLKICEAMGYAHSLTDLQGKPLKIIHRDLTPHNIFLTYDGKVKIIDFGIAKTELHDNKTRVGVVKGKITYMSPEQMAGDELDLRSDIFSIGILLYEMLSGTRMYTGDTATLIRKAITVEYDKLESVMPNLDSNIYRLLDRTLTAHPDDRYQSCEAMQIDLEQCLKTADSGYDPRLLKSFITTLFRTQYEEEKQRGLEVLKSARKFEDKSELALEKTAFLTPGDNVETDPKSSGPALEPQSAQFVSRSVMAAAAVLFVAAALYLVFFEEKSTEKEKTAVIAKTERDVPTMTGEKKVPQTDRQQGAERKKRLAIEQLLGKAESAFNQGNITSPEGGSALYYYREIQNIEPDNNRAADGIRRVAENYAERAEQEISRGRFREAMQLAEKGEKLSPGLARLAGIRNRLANEKQNLIGQLILRAEERLAENKLTTPPEDCALKYYREIEAIDGTSEIVEKGLRKIGNRYALLADHAFQRLDFDRARHYVNEGIEVDPDNLRLQVLELELQKSKPEMIMRGVEKKLKSIF